MEISEKFFKGMGILFIILCLIGISGMILNILAICIKYCEITCLTNIAIMAGYRVWTA